jgi:hypothetical protein
VLAALGLRRDFVAICITIGLINHAPEAVYLSLATKISQIGLIFQAET